jgi:SSS family solute:Na+ symporter
MTNVTWYQILNWSVTIIPIWFVGMTLYQEFMPVKVLKAKLGLLPDVRMANNFMGVILGMLAKVAATKACLTVQMLHQWIAKWDYLYWLPCYQLD